MERLMRIWGCLFFMLFALGLQSQTEKTDYEVGTGFHLQYLFHNGDFSKLNEIPNCCPKFTTGDGSGISAFLFYKIPLFADFSGQIRINYSSFDALFVSKEFTKVSVDDEAIDGEFEHRLEANLSSLLFQPLLSYQFFENFNFNIGFDIGYLLGGSFYQIEKITKPSDRGTYIKDGVDTELREWNEAEGDIPKISSILFGGLAGLSYDFPLNSNKTLWFTPEIFYSLGFNDVAAQTPWTVNGLYYGLSFKYRPNAPVIKPVPGQEPIDETQIIANEIELTGNPNDIYFGEFSIPEPNEIIPKVKLDATISAVGVMEGQEFKEATMVIEEFLSTNMRPLLNYIFFDNNSSVLPDRYILLDEKKANKFSKANLCNITTIRTYYDILNIIGLRLKENPGTKISLTGCNTGKESGGTGLSQQRADILKKYLTDVWEIDPGRISTSARNLPEIASNQNENDGLEENRRVEIKSDSWEIMQPVLTEDTLRKVSPPLLRFYLKTDSDNEIAKWKVTALQNGDILRVFEGTGKVPDKVDWYIDREKETVPKFSDPIEYMVEIIDIKGNQSFSETGLLPTEMITIQKKKDNRVGDKRIDRYSLILFDFASNELSGANTKIIHFIKGNLQSDSRLLISGFTDRMGNEDFNFKLSEDRAVKVGQALNRPTAYKRGVGETQLIYDNDLPEGRFYCRTVEIEVETPMSWNK